MTAMRVSVRCCRRAMVGVGVMLDFERRRSMICAGAWATSGAKSVGGYVAELPVSTEYQQEKMAKE